MSSGMDCRSPSTGRFERVARYDVFIIERTHVLDVQTDLIEELETRAVVPLLSASETPPAIRRLHPVFDVGDQKLVMATPMISAVPRPILGEPVANLSNHHDEIVAALDMLFHGF